MSEARDRLLSTASRLFYGEGLHAVGVDRVVNEAHVTRATLYRHFPSKDDLLVGYLSDADEAIRNQVDQARAGAGNPQDEVRAVAATIADGIRSKGFRGCAFLNAAAEYPAPDHPVHQAVLRHRAWFFGTVTELLAETGYESPEPVARHFVLLRDGAMAAGCLTSDPGAVCEAFLQAVEGIVKESEAAVER